MVFAPVVHATVNGDTVRSEWSVELVSADALLTRLCAEEYLVALEVHEAL